MILFTCDLAISAVASDAGFVSELSTALASRMSASPTWRGMPGVTGTDATSLDANHSRMALVVHQQLWLHAAETQEDATALRARLKRRPGSVCVLTLDNAPVPDWLAKAQRYDLAASGREGMVDFVVKAVVSAGGVAEKEANATVNAEPAPGWSESPAAFLDQPRAQSALRHEFDAITGALEAAIEQTRAVQPERMLELHVQPMRVIARMDDVAISVSWLTGRQPTVADGRLLVIAWRGVAPGSRGALALKNAAPTRERTYSAAGKTANDWCWRADDVTALPYSSANLAADWLAHAAMPRVG